MLDHSEIKTHSIIVPCRGHYPFLAECLDSLAKQWKSFDEIVVMIDNDIESLQIAKEYIDSAPHSATKWKLAYMKNHGGVYKAINAGLELCTSDVISFCGADDMWAPSRAGDVMECFDSPDSIVNTYHKMIDADGNPTGYSDETIGGSFSYHRKMFDKLGIFRQWECSADSDFYYRALRVGGYRCIHRSFTLIKRYHGDQLTERSDTGFGSEKRLAYEAMWHDGTTYHMDDIAEYDLVLERG